MTGDVEKLLVRVGVVLSHVDQLAVGVADGDGVSAVEVTDLVLAQSRLAEAPLLFEEAALRF